MRPLLQQALAERPHALVVQNWAPKSLDDLIRRAVRSGIPVMLAAAGEDRVEATGALGYVGSDNFATGKAGGELMARAGVKHPIVLTIPPGIQLADDRTNGFTRGFGRKVTTVKIPISQLGDTTAMKNIIENTLIKDRSIDGVFSIGSGFNPALMAARSSLGERAKVIHWAAIDGTPEILSGITKKQADFAVDQQLFLQGYEPVKWLALYLRYRFVPIDKLIPTGPAIIDSSNVAQIQALAKRGIR
jgi:simple sugar transport system substrate-binding protein